MPELASHPRSGLRGQPGLAAGPVGARHNLRPQHIEPFVHRVLFRRQVGTRRVARARIARGVCWHPAASRTPCAPGRRRSRATCRARLSMPWLPASCWRAALRTEFRPGRCRAGVSRPRSGPGSRRSAAARRSSSEYLVTRSVELVRAPTGWHGTLAPRRQIGGRGIRHDERRWRNSTAHGHALSHGR